MAVVARNTRSSSGALAVQCSQSVSVGLLKQVQANAMTLAKCKPSRLDGLVYCRKLGRSNPQELSHRER